MPPSGSPRGARRAGGGCVSPRAGLLGRREARWVTRGAARAISRGRQRAPLDDGCRRAQHASFARLLRRPRLFPGWASTPAELSPSLRARAVCSPTAGTCVRGSSPPPGPLRLPLSSSFPLVSGGAALERLFLLPGARRGRCGAGSAGWAGTSGGVLLASLPASLPHPPTPPGGSAARGPFWRSPGGARGNSPFPVFARRARAGWRRGARPGLGARGPRWSRRHVPAAGWSCSGRGQRIAGCGHGRAPPQPA